MAKDFKISKTGGVCHKCEEKMPEDTEIMALVRTGEDELIREDYHLSCWEQVQQEAETPLVESDEILGIWKTRIPKKEEKKKLLIDDNLLMSFFERLENQDDENKLCFRYVLTLILMRKRLLTYKGSITKDGREIWQMKMRRSDKIHEVIDPNMDEDKIAEVSGQLGEIMEGDFD